jgi:RNA polymerase sigma-70 factor, ECF subfamily
MVCARIQQDVSLVPARPLIALAPPPKSFDEMSDEELLGHATAGDDQAWNVFFRRFRGLILSCALKTAARAGMPLGSDDLMDVLGDVSLNMVAHNFRKLRLYRTDGGCSVATWVGVIATSTARDYLRRVRRHRLEPTAEAELEQMPSPAGGPQELLEDHERRSFVDRALASLSPRDQRFVQLYFAEAKSPEAIADELGVSVSTVYSKKAKIKMRLTGMAEACL